MLKFLAAGWKFIVIGFVAFIGGRHQYVVVDAGHRVFAKAVLTVHNWPVAE